MELSITQDVLASLRCPRTKQSLRLAETAELDRWQRLDAKAEGFLVTEDGTLAYPIDDGFPILLLERALEKETSGDSVQG